MSSSALLAIGDFSRATQLSVKMLRHYHQIGLLEPVDVDRASGYRRYSIDQISTAQIIRRFRALEMPLDEIRTVMSTTDIRQRNDLINAHLMRLESQLAHTKRAVESLRRHRANRIYLLANGSVLVWIGGRMELEPAQCAYEDIARPPGRCGRLATFDTIGPARPEGRSVCRRLTRSDI